MPLSEHEQRQLEQIEQALYREDPKFGRLVRSSDPRVHYKRKLAQALVGVVAGAGLLAAGVVTHRLYLEAAGAALVLLSLVWAVVSWRRHVARVRPARAARRVEDEGPGPVRSRPSGADQAGPDDGADGRAVAPPAGGRPPDVAAGRHPAARPRRSGRHRQSHGAQRPSRPGMHVHCARRLRRFTGGTVPGPERGGAVGDAGGGLGQGGHHRGGEDGGAPAGGAAGGGGQPAAGGGAVAAQVL